MSELWYELRHAGRVLARDWRVTLLTVLTLGLGIGVATSLFAVVDAVILSPVVPSQARVVHVAKRDLARGGFPVSFSLAEFEAVRESNRSFEALTAVDHAATGPAWLSLDGAAHRVQLAPVSWDFLQAIVAGPPQAGRWLVEADDTPGAEVPVVVSDRLWREAAGRAPSLVGQRLTWNGTRGLRVVGVAPAAFDYPIGTDVWAAAGAVFDGRDGRFDARNREFAQFELVGRLQPGATVSSATAELSVIARQLAEAFPNQYRRDEVAIEPLMRRVLGDTRPLLLALFGGAALVFVVAGVNVAALLLMRASSRVSERALRIALGATGVRLFRQTLAEALVLGAAAAALALLLIAPGVLAAVPRFAPAGIPRLDSASPGVPSAAFAIVATFTWLVLLGTLPAWIGRGNAELPGVARAFAGSRRGRGLLAFTTIQIAAAVIVATGAGLLVRSFTQLAAIDRGVDAERLSLARLIVPEDRRRDSAALLAFYDALLPDLASLPDVVSATPIHLEPGTGTVGLSAPMLFEGQSREESRGNPWATWEPVLPSHFETLGMPIVRGRGFTVDDRRDTMPVAVVTESVAERYWPGLDPIGRSLRFAPSDQWPRVTVVGVVRDTRYRELRKPWMTVYFAAPQFFFFQPASLVIRTTGSADGIRARLAERVAALMPGASVDTLTPLPALLDRELSGPRAALVVAAVFAAIAAVLAAIGVYGVLSYDVRQRRRELALRSAIGAAPGQLRWSVIRRGLAVTLVGTASGAAAAVWTSRLLSAVLYEVPPFEPVVFGLAALALLTVAVGATLLPARAAAHADPITALRSE